MDNLTLFLDLLACMGLGLFYFSGLWWTLRQLPDARRPALLILGSFGLRMAACALVFYLVMDGHWDRLIVALLGILLIRRVLIRRWGPRPRLQSA